MNRALTAVGYRDSVTAIDRLEAAARVAPGDPEVLRLLAAAYRFGVAELADPPARAALLERVAEVEARAGALRRVAVPQGRDRMGGENGKPRRSGA